MMAIPNNCREWYVLSSTYGGQSVTPAKGQLLLGRKRRMPGKSDQLKAHVRNDPMVPIVGRRVSAALRWRRKSETQAGRAAGVSRQAIANIGSGKASKCRRSVRDAIAKLCGPPITAKYLGGEMDLKIPALSFAPSGRLSGMLIGIDGAGFGSSAIGQLAEAAPQYELEGYGLGRAIRSTANRNKELAAELDPPDLEHTARWMVSLYLWREYLFGDQAAFTGTTYSSDASAFAYHTAEAFAVLLRPWFEGRVRMRPRMLQRWATNLDRMVVEMVRVGLARHNHDLSELVIWEIAGGDQQLVDHLTAIRDDWRERGRSEKWMAKAIRRGDADVE